MDRIEKHRKFLVWDGVFFIAMAVLGLARFFWELKDNMQTIKEAWEGISHEVMLGGEGRGLMSRVTAGESLLGRLVGKAVAYSMSVMEHNSAMGCVVAAPTAGSSGVIPGVLFAMQEEKSFQTKRLSAACYAPVLSDICICATLP